MASQYTFEAIGTHWQIDIYQDINPELEQTIKTAIDERIAIFSKNYSRFRPDSLVTEMSQKSGIFAVPDDLEPLLSLYHKLYMLTGGLVTPMIGQTLVDAGYDANYSLEQKKELETPPAWDEVMEYNHPNLNIKKPVLLDFGAAGKGYLIDIVARILEEHSVTHYCVDAGGDMIHKNDSAITVGLEHPEHTDQVIGVATLQNAALCGSAGNRRKWGKIHHIINPDSLESPRDIIAVWTIAPTTLVADGLTTALFFVPAKILRDEFDFEYLIVRDDFSIEKSEDFPAELFVV